MIIEYSKEDLLQSTVVEPAWYRVRIEEVEERLSKDGNSTNAWLKGKILYAADTKDVKYADVPTPKFWMFNSKAPWNTVGFISALGGEVGVGKRVDIGPGLAGKELDVFIENELYNGSMVNAIKHKYRAPRNE